MPLQDEIRSDIKKKVLPARFTVDDLLRRPCPEQPGWYYIGSETYAEATLRTHPNNRGISIDGLERGNHVDPGGQTPLYYRFGNATFGLIETGSGEDEVPECSEDSEGEGESLFSDLVAVPARPEVGSAGTGVLSLPPDYVAVDGIDPVKIVANTIANTPFQAYFRRSRMLYPNPAVTGWCARLETYFWPSHRNNWEATRPLIDKFTKRFRVIEEHNREGKKDTADLIALFEDICAWGGVKLPESDQDKLYKEVFSTLDVIDQNSCPGKESRINSAWTKLYAVARPESFVIFDSRVATALTSILDPYMKDLSNTSYHQQIKDLGTVQGRGGSRPRLNKWKWPVGYRSWKSQIAANKLCCDIVKYLNASGAINGNRQWNLREVEAVLFMDGY